MAGDILSDVLRSIRFRGAVFYDVRCDAEWVAEAPAAKVLAPAVMPGADSVVEYHVVTRGACWAAIVGETPSRVETGDVVLFPQGDPHVMSSAPGMRGPPLDRRWVDATRDDPKPMPVHYTSGSGDIDLGGERKDAPTHIVCGFLGCDLRPFNPLSATLPRMLHLRAVGAGWIAPMLDQAILESRQRRAGSEAMLQRISEMMFVDAVRRYAETLPPASGGWLAGLGDRYVGRALALLHEAPARDWTIEALASEVALSRSALHERFSHLVGLAPMQYLASWRMQLASGMLRSTNATVAGIALEVGYDSEAAFSRAFKRLVGMPPAAWRRATTQISPRPPGPAEASAAPA